MDNKQNDIKNKDININSVEIKNGKYKITDQDKLNYTFWKTKKDGEKGAVYQQWEAMELDQNSIVSIGYVEEPANFTDKNGKEVNYTDRRIISFRETSATPVTTSQQKPHSEPSVSSQGKQQGQDETFWDKKAYKQCLWNYWLAGDRANPTLHDGELAKVWSVFNQIEQDAEERFSKPKGWDNLGNKLKESVAPDIQETADEMASEPVINTDDIPF